MARQNTTNPPPQENPAIFPVAEEQQPSSTSSPSSDGPSIDSNNNGTTFGIDLSDLDDASLAAQVSLDFNNPWTWFDSENRINDTIRSLLISHGVDQGKNCEFSKSTSNGRKFNSQWFTNTSGATPVNRYWLMHSDNS